MGSADANNSRPAAAPVDVVIPVYNGERFLRAAIESVWQQTVPVARIIVSDDGSTDGTAQLVRELAAESPVPLVLVQQANAGLSAARNLGLRHADAKYVAFLDADDLWHPNKMECQLATYRADGSGRVGLVYGGYDLIDERGEVTASFAIPESGLRGDAFRQLLQGNTVYGSGSNVLVRRELIQGLGGFDESLTAAEDWDMWLRLAEVCEFDYCPEVTVSIRRHDGNMQRDVSHMLQNELRFFGKWAERLPADVAVPRVWRRMIVWRLHKSGDSAAAFLHLAQLPVSVRRRLFAPTFGSVRLYWALARVYLGLRSIGRALKSR
jgi:glycosyltransferase involved in cell wall biosynthesis